MAAASRADSQHPVPEFFVQRAKRIASAPAEAANGLRAVLSRLIYDSFRDPLPAGIRSGEHHSRQVVYTAGDYSVDLCLDSGPGRLHLSLVGQVAHGSQPLENVADLPVLLFSGDRVLAADRSNAFGEFQLETRYAPRLRLSVLLFSLGNRIDLPLPPLFGRQQHRGGLL